MTRIANLHNRAHLLVDDGAVDIHAASGGLLPSAPRDLLERWEELRAWAAEADLPAPPPFDPADLLAPVPDPRQVIAIGLNYRDHADESGHAHPDHLVVFTKFFSALAPPHATVELPSGEVDYETELVLVIGRGGHRIAEEEAWDHVAGLAVGQDLSERTVQLRGPAPQFSLGKSYPGFAPWGPGIVTPDEVPDRDALRIRAVLEGAGLDAPVTLQDGSTSDLIFPVARIVAELSEVLTLHPGDLVFTGTPAGVGASTGRFLRTGQVLTSTVEGVGTIRNRFV